MQTFTYPSFFKFLYRFGNIPVTIMLLLYLSLSVINVDINLWYLIPVILILFIIYYLNKRFLNLYKLVPFKITADDMKLHCTEFLFSKKENIIYYSDIVKLQGGIFDGRVNGLMIVNDGRNKIAIGFYSKIKNVRALETIILSRVNSTVYNEVAEKMGLKKDSQNKEQALPSGDK